MEAQDLARWTRFAVKGGIGKCTAVQDCVAERPEDLMFLKDDPIVVLFQLPEEDQYLGYCEGVVGRFHGSAVHFHSKLKKPVYAKRQSVSGTAVSPPRPVSLSSTGSPQGPSAARPATSPSPISFSLAVPSLSDSRPSAATRPPNSHTFSLPAQPRPGSNHSRIPSTSSSLSHFSSHEHTQSQSQFLEHIPVPVSSAAPISRHARNESIASSRSAYSLISRSSGRVPSRSESLGGSGSEETFTQHVMMSPPIPSSQASQPTPALTEGSSAHSSCQFSPQPTASSSFPQSLAKVPASLFQGRARSGSDKFSHQRNIPVDGRDRSGSDASALRSDNAPEWEGVGGVGQIVVVPAELNVEKEPLDSGLTETSFRSVSIYSVDSEPESTGEDETQVFGRVGPLKSSAAAASVSHPPAERTILIEDSDDDGGRRMLAASPDNLSDAGFDIGMTLLQEDVDDDDSTDDGRERYGQYDQQDREDDETAVGHEPEQDVESEKLQVRPHPRTLAMRVMNPDSASASPSFSESDIDEEVTVLQTALAPTAVGSRARASAEAAPIPARPFFGKQSTSSIGSRSSSRAPTDDDNDEPWESDADIYDDYRYSRYSTYSGSPAHSNSRRASRASTKSGKSKGSERPPLPDEDTWRRNASGAESAGESSKSSTGNVKQILDRESVLSASTTVNRGSVSPVVYPNVQSKSSRRTRTPSPAQAAVAVSPTPGMMSITSPLTSAFRESVESHYSRASARDDDKHEDRRDTINVSSGRVLSSGTATDELGPLRSKSPTFASNIRERLKAESPLLANFPANINVASSNASHEPILIVQGDSPTTDEHPGSRPMTPGHDSHLRVASPPSHPGSTPPSPLNPGFPPSPSSMASFQPPSPPSGGSSATIPLNISKVSSPLPSPSTPRQPIFPPAIPFTGIPRPGLPPAHMQYAQRAPIQNQPPHMYSQTQHPPPESLFSTLHMAGQQRATTIHGHTQSDLLSATGPVPISFLLPGTRPPPPQPMPRPQFAPYGQSASQEAGVKVDSGSNANSIPAHRRPITVPAPPPGLTGIPINAPSTKAKDRPPPIAVRATSVQVIPSGPKAGGVASTPASPLPRANFFPKVGQARPRSRSFSDFSSSEITDRVSKTLGKPRSQEEGNQPFSANSSRPSSPSSRLLTPSQAANSSVGSGRSKSGPPVRPSPGPSPLSLPPTINNTIVQSAPTSPLPSQTVTPSSPVNRTTPLAVAKSPDSLDTQPRKGTLRRAPSPLAFRPNGQVSSNNPISPSTTTFPPQRQNSGHSTTSGQVAEDERLSFKPPSPLKLPATRQSNESERTHSSFTRSDMTSPPPFPLSSPSSSPMNRSGSLRSKISMSALRPKGLARNLREGGSEVPLSPAMGDEETVQVKDMEFELVRPSMPQLSPDLSQNDDSSDSRDVARTKPDLRLDTPSSPKARTGGLLSPVNDRNPLAMISSLSVDSLSKKGKNVDPNLSVQAHRDRELKWMSTINSTDSAQARKSKKIKKLLVEGVPSSVRYLVWAHISDSASKKMPNIYTQLSQRRPAMAQDIERDVLQSFPDNVQLRDPKGPLVSVLFAYIAMVPDLRYHRGLAIIAGNLLLQSPEEDAFWTFLAMMDSYLRPYFMPTSAQMSVDTNLFIKTVETSDSQLATRLFAELNIQPGELCGVWFSSVFAGSLPLPHLHRVWDLFIYEGVPFLFRVGLTILSMSRRYFLEGPKNPNVPPTAYLLRPPPEAFPADPEVFIAQTLAVKLKDDDIRKSRVKMEAAVKQQQQQRAPRISTSQVPSHPHLQGGRVRVS